MHAAVAQWYAPLPSGFALRTRIGATQRLSRDPYGVWDVYFAQTRWRVRPFFQLTNLTNTVYEEIPTIAMPGRGVIGGVEFALFTN